MLELLEERHSEQKVHGSLELCKGKKKDSLITSKTIWTELQALYLENIPSLLIISTEKHDSGVILWECVSVVGPGTVV